MNEKIFRVIEILPLQEGVSQRGAWRNQQIIVEEKVALPRPDRFLLKFAGDHVDLLKDIKTGDEVKVMWTSNVRSYTTDKGTFHSQECNCWSLTLALPRREGTAPLTPTGGVDTEVNAQPF